MNDDSVYKEIKEFFKIEELVSKQVHKKYGEAAWKFMCPRLLHTMLVIRKEIDKSITVNNWHRGGSSQQRGLRENTCDMVSKKTKSNRLYLSAHTLGKALDFDVKGMTAVEVRDWIEENQDILPYKIRLENNMKGKPISWVHIDMIWEKKNPKVYRFNV